MRSAVTIVIAIVLSSACVNKSTPSPKTATSEATPAKPKPPTVASKRPFYWGIQVRSDDDVSDYNPGKMPQLIPMPDSEWKCQHGGLHSDINLEGDYVEVRDVICQLPTGHAVGGRTACFRDPSGKVFEDTQVLVLSDTMTTIKVVVACMEMTLRKPASTPQNPSPPEPGPFEEPKSLDI